MSSLSRTSHRLRSVLICLGSFRHNHPLISLNQKATYLISRSPRSHLNASSQTRTVLCCWRSCEKLNLSLHNQTRGEDYAISPLRPFNPQLLAHHQTNTRFDTCRMCCDPYAIRNVVIIASVCQFGWSTCSKAQRIRGAQQPGDGNFEFQFERLYKFVR